jgi:SpoVK/Ycf46/Vps4 family AAA+-type ATPase
MMANALANYLNKKLLVATFPQASAQTVDTIKLLFREASLHNAIVFFDECEGIFESRSSGNFNVNALLTVVERYDGLLILATNRAFEFDEALHRRISLSVQFECPSWHNRLEIWKTLVPKNVKLAPDVDFSSLAINFELTGGLIKNAVVNAISFSLSRLQQQPSSEGDVVIAQEDFERACRSQVQGQLELVHFERKIMPRKTIHDLVLTEEQFQIFQAITTGVKARKIIEAEKSMMYSNGTESGITVFLYGSPGTGKSSTAEALANEIGKPMRIFTCTEILAQYRNPLSKKTSALADLKSTEAIVIIDGIETLLFSDNEADPGLSVILHYIRNFAGTVIFLASTPGDDDVRFSQLTFKQSAFVQRMTFKIFFALPDLELRKKLWMHFLPESIKSLNIESLAKMSAGFSGETIRRAVFRSAISSYEQKGTPIQAPSLLEQAILTERSTLEDFGTYRSTMFT